MYFSRSSPVAPFVVWPACGVMWFVLSRAMSIWIPFLDWHCRRLLLRRSNSEVTRIRAECDSLNRDLSSIHRPGDATFCSLLKETSIHIPSYLGLDDLRPRSGDDHCLGLLLSDLLEITRPRLHCFYLTLAIYDTLNKVNIFSYIPIVFFLDACDAS